MAITLDAHSDGYAGAAASLTVAHTVSGKNTLLVVQVSDDFHVVDPAFTCTYAGVTMNLDAKVNDTGNTLAWVYMFSLMNPAQGTNNIIATPNVATEIYIRAQSFNGVKQSGQPKATGTQVTDGNANVSITINTVSDACVVVEGTVYNAGGVSAGSGAQLLWTPSTGSGLYMMFASSPTLVTPGGSKTLTIGNGNAGTDWAVAASVYEPAPITLPILAAG